jgi:flagellar basal body-associated protein FliL
MSGFLNISVLVLATMVLVLAGMVGYLYWQQNKLMRAMSSLSEFVKSQFTPALVVEPEPEPESEPEAEAEPEAEDDSDEEDEEDEEDDRVSVNLIEKVSEQKVEIPQVDDDFESKTAPQLRELLNKRGIPYGKRDSKSILLELLKASS